MELNEVIIVSAVRTPIGIFQEALSGMAAAKLGSIVIAESLSYPAASCGFRKTTMA
jgi:acetyl-CoA acetyltransferase